VAPRWKWTARAENRYCTAAPFSEARRASVNVADTGLGTQDLAPRLGTGLGPG
jgi:hypothetical protein